MKSAWVAILMIALLFYACGNVKTESNISTHPNQTQNSWSPTPSISPSQTNTLHPARTPHPTDWLPWKDDPTEIARATSIASFPSNCGYSYLSLISLDGNWLASDCSQSGIVFLFTSRDGARQWKIVQQPAKMDDPSWGDNFCYSFPLHWSNESRYIYFNLYYCVEPDGVPDYGLNMDPNYHAIYQLDTLTGSWIQFTPPINDYSFSPSGRRLMYVVRKGWGEEDTATIKITVIDLKTGENSMYVLNDYLAAADVVWSGDGLSFILSAETGKTGGEFYTTHKATYVLYKWQSNDTSLLPIISFSESANEIYPVEWNDQILTLHSNYYNSDSDYGFRILFLDLNTQKILTPTPTP